MDSSNIFERKHSRVLGLQRHLPPNCGNICDDDAPVAEPKDAAPGAIIDIGSPPAIIPIRFKSPMGMGSDSVTGETLVGFCTITSEVSSVTKLY